MKPLRPGATICIPERPVPGIGSPSSSNWMLQLTLSTFKFTSLPSSLGNCPAKKSGHINTKAEPLRPGTEPTLELIVACIENFQIHKFAEFLGQLSCQKGNTSTRIMKRSDRVLPILPWSSMLCNLRTLSLATTSPNSTSRIAHWQVRAAPVLNASTETNIDC